MRNHFEGTDPIDICTKFLGTADNGFTPTATSDERARV
jgi:hypothetical protein